MTRRLAAKAGKQTEVLLMEHLEAGGMQVMRSDLSRRFPDLIAWSRNGDLFLIEVKYASNAASARTQKSEGKAALQSRPFLPGDAIAQLWLYRADRGGWQVFELDDGALILKAAMAHKMLVKGA